MVKYELTGQTAQKVLKAYHRTQKHMSTAPDADGLTFVVRSLEDVKAVANYLGVEIPEGRGRFPMRRLEETATALGHTIDRSQYGDTVTVLPGTYRVQLMEKVGDKIYPRTGIVTGDQVRPYSQGRGRPSKDAVASAAINVHGWGETYLTDSVQVTRQD